MAEENYLSTPDLSPLEQEVLDEYERLANNMKQVKQPPSEEQDATLFLPLPTRDAPMRVYPHMNAIQPNAFSACPVKDNAIHIYAFFVQLTRFVMVEQLATLLDELASNPTTDILDGLRDLERQTSLAFTLLKASVYSIVLQQEIDWGAAGEAGQGGQGQGGAATSSAMGSDYDD